MKLFYEEGQSPPKESEEILHYSESECQSLLCSLVTSSTWLPEDLRVFKGKKVGYILLNKIT